MITELAGTVEKCVSIASQTYSPIGRKQETKSLSEVLRDAERFLVGIGPTQLSLI